MQQDIRFIAEHLFCRCRKLFSLVDRQDRIIDPCFLENPAFLQFLEPWCIASEFIPAATAPSGIIFDQDGLHAIGRFAQGKRAVKI